MEHAVRTREDEGKPVIKHVPAPLPFLGGVGASDIRRAFRGAPVTTLGPGVWSVSLPNGAAVRVQVDGTISYDSEAFAAGYGRDLANDEQLVASWRRLGPGGLITLAKVGVDARVLDHETFHAAVDLVLTPEECSAVLARWGSFERAAEAYARWTPGADSPAGAFQAIYEFFRAIVMAFRPRWERTFEVVRTGRAWSRDVKPERATPVVHRRLGKAEVERAWRELWVAGKHVGEDAARAHFAGAAKGEEWLEVSVPTELVSASWSEEKPSAETLARAERYAAKPTSLPPGLATFGERASLLGASRLFLQDGNHRSLAAVLRGESVRVFIAVEDWHRFVERADVPAYATAPALMPFRTTQAPRPEEGTREANLWRWFGESKVAETDGTPQVVYHGTPRPGFDSFAALSQQAPRALLYGPGFYFTDSAEKAGGRAEEEDVWVYHPTLEAAEAQPGRRGFVWRDDATGQWVAVTKRWYTASRGYAHGPIADEQECRDQVVATIKASRSFARSMEHGYLTFSESEFVYRALEEYRSSGRRGMLDMLSDQPYNIDVYRILEAAGLARAGGVMPVYLRIERPFDVEAPLPRGQVERILDAAEAVAPPTALASWGTRAWESEEIARNIATRLGRPEAEVARRDDGLWEARVPNEGVATLREALRERYGEGTWPIGGDVYEALVDRLDRDDAKAIVRRVLERAGYDGITHVGGRITHTSEHQVWIAFEPTQIKSAIGNRGTYSREDPRITYATRPTVPEVAAAYERGRAAGHALYGSDAALGRQAAALDLYLGRLEEEIDQSYAAGRLEHAAGLEGEAETVRSALEECCVSDAELGVADHEVATPIEDEVGRPSVEEQLAERYHQYLYWDEHPGVRAGFVDRADLLGNMRGVIESAQWEAGMSPRGFDGSLSDRQVLAAAADCYETYSVRRQRYQERGDPKALKKAKAWAAARRGGRAAVRSADRRPASLPVPAALCGPGRSRHADSVEVRR